MCGDVQNNACTQQYRLHKDLRHSHLQPLMLRAGWHSLVDSPVRPLYGNGGDVVQARQDMIRLCPMLKSVKL